MSSVVQPPEYGHLKPRYRLRKVCKIFGIHEDTLRNWMRDGVPLADGRRLRIHYLPIGPRKTEFECDEVERIYQALRASSGEEGRVLSFRGEEDEEHEERRARTRKRAA